MAKHSYTQVSIPAATETTIESVKNAVAAAAKNVMARKAERGLYTTTRVEAELSFGILVQMTMDPDGGSTYTNSEDYSARFFSNDGTRINAETAAGLIAAGDDAGLQARQASVASGSS